MLANSRVSFFSLLSSPPKVSPSPSSRVTLKSNVLPTPSARPSRRSAICENGNHNEGRSTNANPSGTKNRNPWLNLRFALTHPLFATPAKPPFPVSFGRLAFCAPVAISRKATKAWPGFRVVPPSWSVQPRSNLASNKPMSLRFTTSSGLSFPRTCARSVFTRCFPTVKAALPSSAIITSDVSLLSPRCNAKTLRTSLWFIKYVVVPLGVALSNANLSRNACTVNFPRGDTNETGVAVEHRISSSVNPRGSGVCWEGAVRAMPSRCCVPP